MLRLRRLFWDPELVPDPRGVLGLSIAMGVLTSHLAVGSAATGHLWSESLLLEIAGHLWFLLGPPLSLFLGLRHLFKHGDSLLPLVSVPLAGFLTLVTMFAVLLGAMGSL